MVTIQPIIQKVSSIKDYKTKNIVQICIKKIKGFTNTIVKSNNKELLPIVSVPIVAYNVNWDKISEEKGKLYHPYTDALKSAKKEFLDRNLPWNDSYADSQFGYLSVKGSSIIKQYDIAKQYFQDNNLTFGNYLINSRTGLLNVRGETIKNNCENTKDLLEKNNIKINTSYWDSRTGQLTEYHSKQFGFRGNNSFSSEVSTDYTDIDIPSYDDSAELAEISEIDKSIGALDKIIDGSVSAENIAEVSDTLEHFMDNPLVVGGAIAVASEVLPLVRFLKPAKDLVNGDTAKAAVGTVSRLIDMVVFGIPKLTLAATVAGYFAIVRVAAGELGKNFKPLEAFREVYKGWAEVRDIIEDDFLGRKTKRELFEQKQEEARKLKYKLLQEKEKKEKELIKKKDEFFAEQIKIIQEAKLAALEVEKQAELENALEEVSTPEIVIQKPAWEAPLPSNWKLSDKSRLQRAQSKFFMLLQEYKRIKPNASTDKYDNWASWDIDKLKINSEYLRVAIHKFDSRNSSQRSNFTEHIYTEEKTQERYDGMRKAFLETLNTYIKKRPNADVSKFVDWKNWNFEELVHNYGVLKTKLRKLH